MKGAGRLLSGRMGGLVVFRRLQRHGVGAAAGDPRRPTQRRHHRGVRRGVAAAAMVVGMLDLALAAAFRPPFEIDGLGTDRFLEAVDGARFAVLVAGLMLVLLARGLLHGKRNAWRMALLAAGISLLGHTVKGGDLVGVVVAVCLVVLLLATGTSFPARSDPGRARRGWVLLLAGETVVLLYGVVGLYLLDPFFRESTPLLTAASDGVRLLFLLPPATVVPSTEHGAWFLASVRVLSLIVALLASAWVIATVALRPGHGRHDEERVRALLERYATRSLAYFCLLDDKVWLLSSDREAFIAYKVVGSAAVALGDPVGPPESCREVVGQFLEMCDLNGWAPAFHQCTGEGARLLSGAGLRAVKIGEEAIVDVRSFRLGGGDRKSIRSALRRVGREGLTVRELSRPLDASTMAQLRQVSDAWLAQGGHRERTFTLGQFSEDYLQRTRVLAVVGRDGTIVAFANVIPSFRALDGSFDLMRRRPDSVNGTMDALFIALVELFRTEGLHGMNLGLAPLSGIEGDSLPDRALRLMYERGSAVFNYAGLRAYKDKWGPRWEPRFLVCRAETDLPRVAAAVIRAGELPDPRGLGTRVLAVARRLRSA